eukprot:3400294-Rhodomonas_salina.1
MRSLCVKIIPQPAATSAKGRGLACLLTAGKHSMLCARGRLSASRNTSSAKSKMGRKAEEKAEEDCHADNGGRGRQVRRPSKEKGVRGREKEEGGRTRRQAEKGEAGVGRGKVGRRVGEEWEG